MALTSRTLPCLALNSSALLAVPLGGPSLGGLEPGTGVGAGTVAGSNRQHEGSAMQKEVQ